VPTRAAREEPGRFKNLGAVEVELEGACQKPEGEKQAEPEEHPAACQHIYILL
jgi:hypothetical protein